MMIAAPPFSGWLRCGFLLLTVAVVLSSAAEAAAGGVANKTASFESGTRDGRYHVRPSAPEATNNVTEPIQVQFIASSKPKPTGTGSWKAIKIWSETASFSNTNKRSSSAEKVVSSANRQTMFGWAITSTCALLLVARNI